MHNLPFCLYVLFYFTAALGDSNPHWDNTMPSLPTMLQSWFGPELMFYKNSRASRWGRLNLLLLIAGEEVYSGAHLPHTLSHCLLGCSTWLSLVLCTQRARGKEGRASSSPTTTILFLSMSWVLKERVAALQAPAKQQDHPGLALLKGKRKWRWRRKKMTMIRGGVVCMHAGCVEGWDTQAVWDLSYFPHDVFKRKARLMDHYRH